VLVRDVAGVPQEVDQHRTTSGGVVAAFQLGLGVGVQGHLQGRRRHDRPPYKQES
jgi:hypothetical protein